MCSIALLSRFPDAGGLKETRQACLLYRNSRLLQPQPYGIPCAAEDAGLIDLL
jgi:hypothetical protein